MSDKERLEQIKDAIAHELGLTDDYMDGTYLYHLTRSKSAFAVGTMTLDDFKEIDEELLDEIFNAIEPFFIEQAGRVQELKKQNKRYREALEQIKNSDGWLIELNPLCGNDEAYERCVDIAFKALEGESE